MTAWKGEELNKIGNEEELQIASMRRDKTLRNPVTIWVVRVSNDLYVRAYKGRNSPWFRGTQIRHEGQIRAGGVDKDVTLVEVTDSNVNEQIDAAYRTKYYRFAARIACQDTSGSVTRLLVFEPVKRWQMD
jgi:hypothetical protein